MRADLQARELGEAHDRKVLEVVRQAGTAGMLAGEIQAAAGLPPSTMTRVLRRLVEQKLLERSSPKGRVWVAGWGPAPSRSRSRPRRPRGPGRRAPAAKPPRTPTPPRTAPPPSALQEAPIRPSVAAMPPVAAPPAPTSLSRFEQMLDTFDRHPEGIAVLVGTVVPMALMVLVELVQLVSRVAPQLLPERMRGGLDHTEQVLLTASQRSRPAQPAPRPQPIPARHLGDVQLAERAAEGDAEAQQEYRRRRAAAQPPPPEPTSTVVKPTPTFACSAPRGAELEQQVLDGRLYEGAWHGCSACTGLVLTRRGWVDQDSPAAATARQHHREQIAAEIEASAARAAVRHQRPGGA